ncbi:unnamed protein product, partial [Meganyctiphanes norvegica]
MAMSQKLPNEISCCVCEFEYAVQHAFAKNILKINDKLKYLLQNVMGLNHICLSCKIQSVAGLDVRECNYTLRTMKIDVNGVQQFFTVLNKARIMKFGPNREYWPFFRYPHQSVQFSKKNINVQGGDGRYIKRENAARITADAIPLILAFRSKYIGTMRIFTLSVNSSNILADFQVQNHITHHITSTFPEIGYDASSTALSRVSAAWTISLIVYTAYSPHKISDRPNGPPIYLKHKYIICTKIKYVNDFKLARRANLKVFCYKKKTHLKKNIWEYIKCYDHGTRNARRISGNASRISGNASRISDAGTHLNDKKCLKRRNPGKSEIMTNQVRSNPSKSRIPDFTSKFPPTSHIQNPRISLTQVPQYCIQGLERVQGFIIDTLAPKRGGCQGLHSGCQKNKNVLRSPLSSNSIAYGTLRWMDRLEEIHNFLHASIDENIIKVYGHAADEGKPPCLVYQFMPNGSAEDRLQLRKIEAFGEMMSVPPLMWDQRFKIAQGTAAALQFLHTVKEKPLIHGDVKSANILLDRNYEPKLGDFGLAREGQSQFTSMKGTTNHG